MFNSDRWVEVSNKCCNLNLPRRLLSEVQQSVMASKEESTVRNYSNSFKKFVSWCRKCSFNHLSASPVTVALYMVSIIQTECSAASTLNQVFYSIKWAHDFSQYNVNPCEDNWLKLCLEGCIRKIRRPIVKKEPITLDILKSFVYKFASEECSLAELIITTLFIICFAANFGGIELENN
ncbi:hypothetical protein ACF0H5_010500 [Mactra antiquata]